MGFMLGEWDLIHREGKKKFGAAGILSKADTEQG